MIITPFSIGLDVFGLLLMSFFAHELGHVWMAWRYKKRSKLEWHSWHVDVLFETKGLSILEIKSVYLAGILLGLLPLLCLLMLPLTAFGLNIMLFLLSLIMYWYYCSYDLKQAARFNASNLEAVYLVMSPLSLFVIMCLLTMVSLWYYGVLNW